MVPRKSITLSIIETPIVLIFAALMPGTTVGIPFIVEYEYDLLLWNLHKWSAQFIGYGRFSVRRALQGHIMEERQQQLAEQNTNRNATKLL